MGVSQSTDKKFVSQNYSRRAGLMPTKVTLTAGWFLAAVALVAALSLLPQNFGATISLLVASGLISFYMFILTRRLTTQSHLRYELFITDSEVLLFTYDTTRRKQFAQSLPLTQVRSAEYFSARDVACLCIRGSGHELNIPLWAFGKASEQILDALSQRGVSYTDGRRTSSSTRF